MLKLSMRFVRYGNPLCKIINFLTYIIGNYKNIVLDNKKMLEPKMFICFSKPNFNFMGELCSFWI
jgi:hypothetical protein